MNNIILDTQEVYRNTPCLSILCTYTHVWSPIHLPRTYMAVFLPLLRVKSPLSPPSEPVQCLEDGESWTRSINTKGLKFVYYHGYAIPRPCGFSVHNGFILYFTQPTLLNVIQYWHNYDTILMNKLSLVCQGVTTCVTDWLLEFSDTNLFSAYVTRMY